MFKLYTIKIMTRGSISRLFEIAFEKKKTARPATGRPTFNVSPLNSWKTPRPQRGTDAIPGSFLYLLKAFALGKI